LFVRVALSSPIYPPLFKETTMKNPAEQMMTSNQANVEAFEGAVNQAYAGVEKLVELNMAATKAALGESFGHLQAVMSAKTPQDMMALQTSFLQPMGAKSMAYFQHVQSIATDGHGDLTAKLESQMADAQKAFGDSIEQMTKNAPAGSEAAVAAFQSAMSNGQKAVETAQAAIKKATDTAQANFDSMSKQAAGLAKKAGKAA
jgi:phasin family protein